MTADLDQRRDRLVHYVASSDHPWNSTETVKLFEDAVRADERDKWADPERDTDKPKPAEFHPPHCGCLPCHSVVF